MDDKGEMEQKKPYTKNTTHCKCTTTRAFLFVLLLQVFFLETTKHRANFCRAQPIYGTTMNNDKAFINFPPDMALLLHVR